MKTGKITAKLRDAVPVCLIIEGKEVKRYKNIELPDAIKEIEMRNFHFYIPQDGRITFQIHYEKGVLPDIFPAPRAKMTRAEKAKRQPPRLQRRPKWNRQKQRQRNKKPQAQYKSRKKSPH